MTLSEMASMVCSKVGQTDAASIAVCKDYLNRRYQMIADAFYWKDIQMFDTVAYPAGTDSVALPAGMERITSARLHGTNQYLDPVDAAFLVETDPGAFDRTGTPLMYEEQMVGSTHRIRLLPGPATNVSVFLVGRKVLPTMGNTDSPYIRNIDNALLAFAMADMLERQRQYGKAQAKVQEAGALLEAAKRVETEQSNRRRQAKQLTASGNTLGELADDVCARIGDFAPETYILVKQFLRRTYRELWNSRLWKESMVAATVASDGEFLICPHYFDEVTAVRADPDLAALGSADINHIMAVAPGIFEETTGIQSNFSYLTPVAVKVLPPGLEKLNVRSTSASDTGTVFVMGESSGVEANETVTLNGTTNVATTNFYDVPLTITAPAGMVGTLIVTGVSSGVELQRIPTWERERKHIRLWLTPPNLAAEDCLVIGKRKINPLVNDQDTMLLRHASGYLIEAATGDAFSRFGKPAEAQTAWSRAEAARNTLVNMDTKQAANQPRVMPSVEGSYYGGEWYGKAYF